LKPDKYKDIIIDSLKFLVEKKHIEINVFAVMSNHIHLIWQIQAGHDREAVQRDFFLPLQVFPQPFLSQPPPPVNAAVWSPTNGKTSIRNPVFIYIA
jgi:hypothetical protein